MIELPEAGREAAAKKRRRKKARDYGEGEGQKGMGFASFSYSSFPLFHFFLGQDSRGKGEKEKKISFLPLPLSYSTFFSSVLPPPQKRLAHLSAFFGLSSLGYMLCTYCSQYCTALKRFPQFHCVSSWKYFS